MRLGAFVHLIDELEMKGLVGEWPASMNVALCVSRESCTPVVFHSGEAEEVLDRVSERLGLPVGAFAATHRVEGIPYRSLLFSEEQELHRLTLESPGLVEQARDHAINFAFAQEEGLDPGLVTRPAERSTEPRSWTLAPSAEDRPPAPQPAAEPGRSFPEGYRLLREEDHGALLLDVSIACSEDWVSLSCGPEEEQAIHAVEADSVALRKDFGGLFLPHDAYADLGDDDIAFRLLLPCEAFPDCMLDRIGAAGRSGVATVTRDGIFVSFGEAVSAPKPVIRRWRLPVAQRAAALVATSFVFSALLGAALQAGLDGRPAEVVSALDGAVAQHVAD
ncbi:hypothetical protein [Histidinibacterium aquaticum]|uniref:hypothetical protein n=1 Tax=Histidinibacterium aquaticum TaxID=2613962 RepID=UPI00168AD242|nr:hypothetical protein [Histidinibacterium aquaticum]